MISLTQINRRKRCVNIPRSKKGAPNDKCKCGLNPGEATSYSGRNDSCPGGTTPGEQDIGRNDRIS